MRAFTTLKKICNRKIVLIPAIFLLASIPVTIAHAEGFPSFPNLMHSFVVNVFGLWVAVGGGIFDYAINNFVVNFGVQYQSVDRTVTSLWITVRDLFNLTFIFGLVYIGFRMILFSEDNNARRWLINLIIAALLVNFSLFMTKFVVDVSNIAATQIINLGIAENIIKHDPVKNELRITNSLMTTMKLTTNYSVGGVDTGVKEGNVPEGANVFGYIVGTAFLFGVAGFVFMAGGVMLLLRAFMLILFIILSPFMFIGLVFPNFMGEAQKMIQSFLKRAFFAPIYFALLFISLSLIDGYQTFFAGANLGSALNAKAQTGGGDVVPESFASSFVSFFLICFFLVSALIIAQRLGVTGAATAMKYGKQLGRAALGGAAGMPTRFFNRRMQGALDTYDRLGNSWGGRALRGTLAVGSLGVLSSRNVRDALGAGANASVFGSETAAQNEKRRNTERQSSTKMAKSEERSKVIRNRKAEQNQVAAAIRNMSPEELVSLLNSGDLRPEHTKHITDSQLNAMENNGLLRSPQVDKLRNERNKHTFTDFDNVLDNRASTLDKVRGAQNGLAQSIRNMSNERLANLDIKQLTNERIAMHLSDSQIDSLRQSGNFTSAEIQQITDARKNGLATYARTGRAPGVKDSYTGTYKDPVTGASVSVETTITRENREKLISQPAQVPVSVFMLPEMAAHISPQALEVRMRAGGITDTELRAIKATINTYLAGTPAARPQWDDWIATLRPEASRYNRV